MRGITNILAAFVFAAPAMAQSEASHSMTTQSFIHCQKAQQQVMGLISEDYKLVPVESGIIAIYLQIDRTIMITCRRDKTAEIYTTGVAIQNFPGLLRAFEALLPAK